jgi:hypothetical protein
MTEASEALVVADGPTTAFGLVRTDPTASSDYYLWSVAIRCDIVLGVIRLHQLCNEPNKPLNKLRLS